MTRYYLDVKYPNFLIADETGHDFPDLGAAVRVAYIMLTKIHGAISTAGLGAAKVEISDDTGLVATVPVGTRTAVRDAGSA